MADNHDESTYLEPPAAIQQISDLLRPTNPRWVVATARKWMEPYNSLEETEISIQARTCTELGPILKLSIASVATSRARAGAQARMEGCRRETLAGLLGDCHGSSTESFH
jgi:hypothetical protein